MKIAISSGNPVDIWQSKPKTEQLINSIAIHIWSLQSVTSLMATMFSWLKDPIIRSSRIMYARCGWSVSSIRHCLIAYTCLLECRQLAFMTAPLALNKASFSNIWDPLFSTYSLNTLPAANLDKVDVAFFRILFHDLRGRHDFSHHFIELRMWFFPSQSGNRFWDWEIVRGLSCRNPWFLDCKATSVYLT